VATPRYHPGVIWGPFLLALALGLVVSAGLYFAYLWPAVEPETDAEMAAKSPAPETAKAEPETEPAASEPETSADAPASESSPT